VVRARTLDGQWFAVKVHWIVPDQDHFGLLLGLEREPGSSLRGQLERRLRAAVRDGRLHPQTRLPSSRALARQLGVSRGVVVEAYSQLVAEGYLTARQGDGTRVSAPPAAQAPAPVAAGEPRPPRYDFRLGVPDLSAFPRAAWVASTRRALRALPDAALGHPDPRGAHALRTALAAYLGRVRGVVTTPERVVVCTGFWQGLRLICGALRARGARRLAMEDPSFVLHRALVADAGLEPVAVPVDGAGVDVAALEAAGVDAVLVTPAHQFPTGVVLAPERRTALLAWAQRTGALVVEDDYDAEYRYDREPVGALQGLAPDRVAYGGTASKTLAPALRLGWVALPAWLAGEVGAAKGMADAGTGVLDQLTYADFLARGELDRHLRRTRLAYRRRRDVLARALARRLPTARLRGVAAGLHAVVELPPGCDETAVVAAAQARGVAVEAASVHRFGSGGAPALLLGYARLSEPAIRRGVAELAAAVAAVSRRGPDADEGPG
jgi:GntR family transcriptional regulator/MocR family aminotransferase